MAQYKIDVALNTPIPDVYTCTINIDQAWNTANGGINTWSEDDLITWIFPDGQVKQNKIDLSGTNVINNSNQIEWRPYRTWTSDKNIVANITKKGGTGNPSLTQVGFVA